MQQPRIGLQIKDGIFSSVINSVQFMQQTTLHCYTAHAAR